MSACFVFLYRQTSLEWDAVTEKELVNEKLHCSMLVIAVGQAASGFCQSYLLSSESRPIGWLSSVLNENESGSYKNAEIFRCKGQTDVMVCCCIKDVSPESAFCWVNKLFTSFLMESAEVAVLTSLPSSEYRTEIPYCQLAVPFLRSLRTTNTCKQRPPCPYLEQPNLVTGLPAQILTHCQVFDIPAQVFICYLESLYIDSSTMRAFLPVLKLTKLNEIPQNNPEAEEMVTKIVDMYTSQSTLYL